MAFGFMHMVDSVCSCELAQEFLEYYRFCRQFNAFHAAPPLFSTVLGHEYEQYLDGTLPGSVLNLCPVILGSQSQFY